MNNYRRQDACVNCAFVKKYNSTHGGDAYICWLGVDESKNEPIKLVHIEENGICDNYEKKLAVEKSSCVITNKTHEGQSKDSA